MSATTQNMTLAEALECIQQLEDTIRKMDGAFEGAADWLDEKDERRARIQLGMGRNWAVGALKALKWYRATPKIRNLIYNQFSPKSERI